jgi:hypothetical protein
MSALAALVAHVSSSNLAAPTGTQTMSERNQHVVPRDHGWAIRGAGAKRDTGHFDRKQDAVDRAREISQNQGTEPVQGQPRPRPVPAKGLTGNDRALDEKTVFL